jgi:hypothetical protein
MDSSRHQQIAERFQLALALDDFSERMLRQRLRRKYPEAPAAEIDAMIGSWRVQRPGAEHGDGEGTPIAWPPRRG